MPPAGDMNENEWRDRGVSEMLPGVWISVFVLPTCVRAIRIISCMSVVVRLCVRLRWYQHKTGSSRRDVRD